MRMAIVAAGASSKRCGELMQSAGLIKEVPGSWKDLVYPNLENADGS